MSLQDQTLSSTMNKDRSFANRPKAVTQKSEKDCKVFKTISKYFSDKEWAKLGYSEKTTYVYMKRNYDTMTGLGLKTTLPAFMCRKKWATKSSGHNSDEGQDFKNKDESLQKDSVVQERKRLKVMHKKPKEKNDLDPVPVALGSEQAQKQQSPPGEDSISDKQIKKIPESKKAMNSRAYILRERKNLVAYEEISDPEEED
ncbi:protein SSXA1-like [Suricata suricatta]|uniref:protein SSXA1-like n=1 Tax=Suricata suricatta TaxID=37032 RepID=UPI00115594B7|nr:protein SSXA1-like [Suricata suricatta]